MADFVALVYTGIVCSLQLIRINKLKSRLNWTWFM